MNGIELATVLYGEDRTAADVERVLDLVSDDGAGGISWHPNTVSRLLKAPLLEGAA